jgi:hypothetical protein
MQKCRMKRPQTDIISRMEATQQRFGRLQLCDRDTRKAIREYYDRQMANRSDNGTLDYLSDEQGAKELGEGWRQ